MANTFVKLGKRAGLFYDDLSGIKLDAANQVARLEDFMLRGRVMTALLHDTIVQITPQEYNSIIRASLAETSMPGIIQTTAPQFDLVENVLFENVVGPINAPPTSGIDPNYKYLLGDNPSGDWKGRAGQVAHSENGQWVFDEPNDAAVAILTLFPDYFYYYKGDFPEGNWEKYPMDPITIPTIDDVYSNISIQQQQTIVNNNITNINQDKKFIEITYKIQETTLDKFKIPTPPVELLVFVEGQFYRRDNSPMGYYYDAATQMITFNVPLSQEMTLQILYR